MIHMSLPEANGSHHQRINILTIEWIEKGKDANFPHRSMAELLGAGVLGSTPRVPSTNSIILGDYSEKDVNGDVLWTWVYPAFTAETKALCDRKAGLREDDISAPKAVFARHNDEWFYIYTAPVSALENAGASQVRICANVVIQRCDIHLDAALVGAILTHSSSRR